MPFVKIPLSSQDDFLTVNGHNLKTRWLRHRPAPPSDAPVVVFLHEGLGCIDLWGDFPTQVAAQTGLNGFLYDRLGHGRSDPLTRGGIDPDYQHAEAQADLPEVLAKNRISRCIFFGHSEGGTIALLFAADRPQGVQGIITEAAHVFVDHLTLGGIEKTKAAYRQGKLKNKLSKYHGANTDALFRRWAETWCWPQFSSWNIEAILPRIRCPVLAIQGQEDEYGLARQAHAIAAGVGGPGEAWIIPGCRHVPHRQAPRLVLERCCRFIQHITQGATQNPA